MQTAKKKLSGQNEDSWEPLPPRGDLAAGCVAFRGLMTEFDQCGERLLPQQRKVQGKIKTGEKREGEWRGGKAGARAPRLPCLLAGGWGGWEGTWGSALWSPCLYTRVTSIQGP